MSRMVFLCCHLSGTGHLVRTLTIARAARARGHDVTVISGGRPLDHVDASGLDLVQLPPLIVRDLDFSAYWTPDGTPADATYMTMRETLLGNTIAAVRPDALITELFPFGRRRLAAEFRHAIARAQDAEAPAKIVCSVRDVPEPKPKRQAEVAAALARAFDAVLVHGDARFLALSETWPLAGSDLPPIHHTGYVTQTMPLSVAHNPGVLVAVGGGALGQRLLDTAARAAALSARPWLVLVGGGDAAARAVEMTDRLGRANLTIEPARPDYRALMASADCSISLCGYNTAVELAQCRTPAVLVPSEEGGEQEQLIRARRLARFSGIELLREDDLTPTALANAAEAATTSPRRDPLPLGFDDGSAAVACIEDLIRRREHRA